MPPITVEEVVQRLKDRRLNLELVQEPVSPRQYSITNRFGRVMAYVVGLGAAGAIPIEATASGELKVATTGAGFDHNDVRAKAAAADGYTEFQFVTVVSRVDIWVWDQQATVKRKPTEADAFDDEIVVDANQFYSFDCSTSRVAFKNTTPGLTAVVQIVGWF